MRREVAAGREDAQRRGRHLAKVERENAFVRDLNESLLRDTQKWQEEIRLKEDQLKEKDAMLREKDEQLRDLMVFLEAQSMATGSGSGSGGGAMAGEVASELKEGTVSLEPPEGAAAAAESKAKNATHARLMKKLSSKRGGK